MSGIVQEIKIYGEVMTIQIQGSDLVLLDGIYHIILNGAMFLKFGVCIDDEVMIHVCNHFEGINLGRTIHLLQM
ncbi:MAG: hypothetical protein LBC61_01150 [Candidatus Peribacteria bacterium]|nr:hypothetical protein [Candidatus Peribacteria bacterium]